MMLSSADTGTILPWAGATSSQILHSFCFFSLVFFYDLATVGGCKRCGL